MKIQFSFDLIIYIYIIVDGNDSTDSIRIKMIPNQKGKRRERRRIIRRFGYPNCLGKPRARPPRARKHQSFSVRLISVIFLKKKKCLSTLFSF